MTKRDDERAAQLPKAPGHLSPRGHPVRDGIRCGVCALEDTIREKTRARILSIARAMGWRYVETFGWVCASCQNRIPGLRDPRQRLRDPGPKTRAPQRLQVSLQLGGDDDR